MLRCALTVLLLLAAPMPLRAAPWHIDPATEVLVDVDWAGSQVEVRFPSVTGTIAFDERDLSQAAAEIAVASADATTGLAPVDALLRSDGYLAAGRFPEIVFHLDSLVRTSSSTADVKGSITLRGVTRPISFAATVIRFGPVAGDPARYEAGFDLAGSLDRTAFGSVAGLPEVPAVLPVRIRLLMSAD